MGDELTVYCAVTAKNGARVPLIISPSTSPTELRRKASSATKIPLDSLRLIFRGRMIKDETGNSVVEEYKLDNECVLHCMGEPEEVVTAEPVVPASVNATTAGSSVSIPSAPAGTDTTMTALTDDLTTAINELRASNSPSAYLTAITTLDNLLKNIIANPMEEKYRRVKRSNAAFAKRLGGVAGGDAAIKAAGFAAENQNGDETYVMHASADAWPKLMAAKTTIANAVAQAKAEAATPSSPENVFGGGAPGAMPGLTSGSMPGSFNGVPGDGMNPVMQNAMADMLSNPETLRAMMQVCYSWECGAWCIKFAIACSVFVLHPISESDGTANDSK